MASVDGSRSYLAGSDEIIQHACGPCKDDGETKEGQYLCEFCNVYLCFDCRNDHKTFKATKNHSIVSAHISQTGSMTTTGTFSVLCGCDQKRTVEVYCETHTEVICLTCEAVKHWNCQTCPIKDKATKTTKKQFMEFADKAKSLKTGIESLKQNAETNQKKLDSKKEECRREIAAFRREINILLDEMEKKTLITLDKRTNQHIPAIEKQIATLTASLQALNSDLGTIDNANKTNSDEIRFAANAKLSKNIVEYEELINDIRKNTQIPKVEFVKNNRLLDVLATEDGLGRIELSTETRSTQQDHVGILGMKVKSTKKINIKLPDDDSIPNIIGCTFLSNGCILLCDNRNKKLKLLDSDMSIKKSLKLSKEPDDITAVSGNDALIIFGGRKHDVQYIHAHPELKLGNKIAIPDSCYGLHVANNELYTAYQADSGREEIWRLDMAGNIMSKIVLTRSYRDSSWHYGLSLTVRSPCVYLSEWYNGTVRCFQLDGKIVYQYNDKELKGPNEIYVDSAGNSLVCGTNSNNVVVITAGGRKHTELLTAKNIKRPKCIDIRPGDNTLIVGCWNESELFVFKLGY